MIEHSVGAKPGADVPVDLVAPSPYAGRKLGFLHHVPISIYWFATNFLWGALLTIMLPGELRAMAPHYRVMALGLQTGISSVVPIVVPLIVGGLSDRCVSKWGRRRPYIATGVVLNVIGLALMAMVIASKPVITGPIHEGPAMAFKVLITSPIFLLFLGAYSIVQLGNNVATAAYSGIIPDLVPEDQIGAASGYMALMSQLGTLFGAVGCAVALAGQPEPIKYGLLIVVLILGGLVTVFGIKETPLAFKPPKIVWGKYLRSLWISPREYPDFAWVWITRALVMLGFYSILPFINYYLIDVIGIEKPDESAGKLIAVILIFSSISGIAGGYISDKIGRKKVVYISNMIIAVMTLAFIVCHSFTDVLLAGVLFGLGFGAYTSVDWALGTQVLPSKTNAAKEMGVWHVAMTLPQSVAAPIAGLLIESFGKHTSMAHGELQIHYTTTGYAAVFVMSAICFALGAYLLHNVRGVK